MILPSIQEFAMQGNLVCHSKERVVSLLVELKNKKIGVSKDQWFFGAFPTGNSG